MVNFNISNTVLNSEVFIIGLPDHQSTWLY